MVIFNDSRKHIIMELCIADGIIGINRGDFYFIILFIEFQNLFT